MHLTQIPCPLCRYQESGPLVYTYLVPVQAGKTSQVFVVVICYRGEHPLWAGPRNNYEEYFNGLPLEKQTLIVEVARACVTGKSRNYQACPPHLSSQFQGMAGTLVS